MNNYVSIHYMSLVQIGLEWVAEIFNKFQYIICHWFKIIMVDDISINTVSIHYMSLVQPKKLTRMIGSSEFQYIICHWFKFRFWCIVWLKSSFNTLYVIGSIALSLLNPKATLFQYIMCHWFNNWFTSLRRSIDKFQYIICHWFK